jgi:hypothetical protein
MITISFHWFRSVGSNGLFHLGASHYYLGKRFAHRSVAIGFDPGTMALICQPEGSEDTLEVPIQDNYVLVVWHRIQMG